ncbi:MAG: EamA/RhaT family transporter [Bacteroidota bacterium]
MIYLFLSVAASTLIFIIFKLFNKFGINTLHAIIVNYAVAFLCGILAFKGEINITSIVNSDWFLGAVFLGFLFISIFNVMALTSQRNGLSVASVASKMSVVIPVIFGIYVYDESTGLQKIIGIILALLAVYLTSIKTKTTENFTKGLWLPVILFFGSGIIDTSIKFIETTYLPDNGIPIFSATVFVFAFTIGSCLIAYKAIFNKKAKTNTTNHQKMKLIIGGSILGIVNYASIYYLLKALDHDSLESSVIFTVNNVAIVMLTTLIGLMAFKETISKTNWAGIFLAIVSIALVTFA